MRHLIRDTYNKVIPFKTRSFIYKNTKLQYYRKTKKFSNGDKILQSFDRNKAIFVHIPKTGGISIKKSLFGYSSLPHLTAAEYRVIFGDEIYEKYLSFAFVRNPWDRVISAYDFLKKGGFSKRDSLWSKTNISQYKDFEHFVCKWLNSKNAYTHVHFIPQSEFVCNSHGNIDVTYLGYFENLQEDFAKILNQLDIDTELKLKHLNKSNKIKNNYRDYYTKSTKEIVAKVYHKDIELFGYEFN